MEKARVGREHQIYTSDGVRKVVGVIPILPDGRIVLISSSKRRNVWIIPKGGAEDDETSEQSALREAFEEAGLRGSIRSFLCNFRTEKADTKTGLRKLTDFDFFLMDVTICETEWPESHSRAREYFSATGASEMLKNNGSNSLHIALKAFMDQIESNIN
ncbi:hypothetical protein HK100_001454 [Physocladia obscura]|uniref:Nudix hydrolase domain-containing protein n=1 Tax=Physocladia obscura TaxID=109957 RepID=A0AAD5SWT3_9FUNG|nr:hypothetical protein HK100_001454 [Physocladia obscura]